MTRGPCHRRWQERGHVPDLESGGDLWEVKASSTGLRPLCSGKGETAKVKGKGALDIEGAVIGDGTSPDLEAKKEPNQNLLQNHLGLSAASHLGFMAAWGAEMTIMMMVTVMMMVVNKTREKGLVPQLRGKSLV